MRHIRQAACIGGAIFFGGAIVAFSARAETPQIPDELPRQCYEPENLNGIPASYNRESMMDLPALERRVEPAYPDQASPSREFYCAAISFSVDEKGRVADMMLLYNSHPEIDGINFAALAEQSLAQWQFMPGTIDLAPAKFIGMTTVFYRGFGDYADISHLQQSAAQAGAQDYVADNWENYGHRVTQAELDLLAEAISPDAVKTEGGEEALAELIPQTEEASASVIRAQWYQDPTPIFLNEQGERIEKPSLDNAISEAFTLTGEAVPKVLLVGEEVQTPASHEAASLSLFSTASPVATNPQQEAEPAPTTPTYDPDFPPLF